MPEIQIKQEDNKIESAIVLEEEKKEEIKQEPQRKNTWEKVTITRRRTSNNLGTNGIIDSGRAQSSKRDLSVTP